MPLSKGVVANSRPPQASWESRVEIKMHARRAYASGYQKKVPFSAFFSLKGWVLKAYGIAIGVLWS